MADDPVSVRTLVRVMKPAVPTTPTSTCQRWRVDVQYEDGTTKTVEWGLEPPAEPTTYSYRSTAFIGARKLYRDAEPVATVRVDVSEDNGGTWEQVR